MSGILRYGRIPIWACVLLGLPSAGQTTQGIILGHVVDAVTGQPVPSASIVCTSEATTAASSGKADASGAYAIGSLSPGRYRITVSASQYQSQQARALELPVSGRVDLNFRLRPLYDVWEAGQYRSG